MFSLPLLAQSPAEGPYAAEIPDSSSISQNAAGPVAAPLTVTQMGEQIERGPAIQLTVRALGVHDVTGQKLTFDWKQVLIH